MTLRALEDQLQSRQAARKSLRFLSTAFLRRLAKSGSQAAAIQEVREFSFEAGFDLTNASLSDFYRSIYTVLKKSYRVEAIYKEAVLNWWVNRSGNRLNCGVLFEMRVGRSKLDAVCVGKLATAFEIKTSYDSPVRLANQLLSYRTRFPRVFVVLPKDVIGKFERHIPVGVGLMCMTSSGGLEVLREEPFDPNWLESSAMLSLLRRGELLDLLKSNDIDLRSTPNTRLMKEAVAAVSDMSTELMATAVAAQLLGRTSRLRISSLRSLQLGLRSVVVGAGVSERELPFLLEVLEQPL